ncbi:hypothetical protein ACFYST_17525 [Kitasatospora sp. NPDC004614]|uniref:hypothetical protein n=1 Tax=unclassified Kitasatospora TaxID=2633591 RepID=UPI0036C01EE8
MTERFGGRREWRLLCVVAVLSALLHLLACAHGPFTGISPSADSVPSAAAHCPSPSDRPDGPSHQEECQGVDQPVTTDQHETGPHAASVALLAPAPRIATAQRPCARGMVDRGGTTRAALGSWRT